MNPKPQKGARPSHDIFVVEPPKEPTDKDGNPNKGFFTQIGAAWPTKNGTGYNIKLKALPLDGMLTMMPVKKEDEQQ